MYFLEYVDNDIETHFLTFSTYLVLILNVSIS